MKSLPIDATDSEIRKLVVEWNNLLANEMYEEALALFPFCEQRKQWTPELLKRHINGYGVPSDPDDEELIALLQEWEVDEFKITLLNPDDINSAIDVDRENLYGLNPDEYIGMVHFNDIPLSGYISDLTALFHIKKVDDKRMTLEFFDCHVM